MMNYNTKIIVWNCRGAAGKDFFKYSKYYCDMYRPEAFVFMETRCDPIKLHKPLKKLGFQEFFSVTNDGFAGGIIVASKIDNLKFIQCDQDEQWINLTVKSGGGIDWRFT